MISVIDMPPPDESIWWRGKRGFEVGFFPCECVEVIGDKLPQNLNLPPAATSVTATSAPTSTGDRGKTTMTSMATIQTSSDEDEIDAQSPNSEPTKPVLRKHGKLISFFRSFILSRPTRGKLKKSGILKERVFGCDLSEHLLNTGQEGKTFFAKNRPSPATFSFIFVFSNKHYNFYNKYVWKMSIQYTVLGFEHMTFKKWVSSHNH